MRKFLKKRKEKDCEHDAFPRLCYFSLQGCCQDREDVEIVSILGISVLEYDLHTSGALWIDEKKKKQIEIFSSERWG